MINNIKIENFRQFDKLEINDFKRVNFIVGQNGSGKTTVLEALYWASNPTNMKVFNLMSIARNMHLRQNILSTLFYKKNEELPINIDVAFIDKKNNHSFHLGVNMGLPKNDGEAITVAYNDAEMKYDKKEYNYTVINTYDSVASLIPEVFFDKDHYRLVTDNKGVSLQPQGMSMIIKHFHAILIYMPAEFTYTTLYQSLNYLISESKEDKLIEYLKIFDGRVSGIVFDINKQILVELEEENEKFKLPLNLLGDGFSKLLNVVSCLLDNKNPIDVILIDEIENGLHFKNIKNLIRAILKLSKEMNIQMVITTHNYEVLKYLSEIAEEDEFESEKEDMQVINIAKTKLSGFKSYNYSMDGLINFIETETEIRE